MFTFATSAWIAFLEISMFDFYAKKKKKKKKTSSDSSQMLNPSETRNMQNKIRYCIIGQSACGLFFFCNYLYKVNHF